MKHAAEECSWDELLQCVRSDFHDIYRSWFEDLRAGVLAGGVLRVQVDDPARARYLRDHCTQAFSDSAMLQTGHLVTVEFVCEHEDDRSRIGSSELGLASMPISPDFTFDQFVVGPSNRLAHAACTAVCGQPGTLYNPLFIHGGPGLGKTHLLQAVCAELLGTQRVASALYVSCETFINAFVQAIERGALADFRESVRSAGVLVIDDIQFLANREPSQEEFFHTFNAVYQARHQIILSADFAPAEIPTLEDRLVSRFNWGLVTHIDPPNRETRQAILQKKARLRGIELPPEMLDLIAERVQSDVRTLEGALNKLATETQIDGKPITVEAAEQALAEFDHRPTRSLQVSDILDVISKHFSVRLPDLVGRKRSRSVSHPRQVGMYLARKLTPLSLEEIGSHFGGRDHSTVLHAERVIEAERTNDKLVSETVSKLTRLLLARR